MVSGNREGDRKSDTEEARTNTGLPVSRRFILFNIREIPGELVESFILEQTSHNRRYLRIVSFFGLFAVGLLFYRLQNFGVMGDDKSLKTDFLVIYGVLAGLSLIHLAVSYLIAGRLPVRRVRTGQRAAIVAVVIGYMLLANLELQLAPDFSVIITVILFFSVTMWVDTLTYLSVLLLINLTVVLGFRAGVHPSVSVVELSVDMILFSILGLFTFFAVGEGRMRNFMNAHLLRTTVTELRDLSVRDPLTMLFNRRMMNDELDRELALSGRTGRPVAIILMDLDRFKRINDSLGHSTGDQVLRDAGSLIENLVRVSDRVYRFGGEEFLVMLPETSIGNAGVIAERLLTKFRNNVFEGVPWTVTVSMGLADNAERRLATDLINLADSRLYAAKNAGRDRYVAAGGTLESPDALPEIPDA